MSKVAVMIDDQYEDLELWYPKIRLEEAGIKTVVVGEKQDHIYRSKHGYPCLSESDFNNLSADNIDGIVIPGGFAPDKLRRLNGALELTRHMDFKKRLIAFICHGGWVPISAKVLKGVQVTGTSAIKDDLENAGAIWNDQPLVRDKHFISARNPGDLAEFGKAIVDFLLLAE